MTNNKHIEKYNAAIAEYGSTEWEGEEYALLQDPYLDGTNEDLHYSGTAMDKTGNIYQVRWETTEEYDELCERWRKEYEETGEPPFVDGDESMACDWWNPTSVTLIDTIDESCLHIETTTKHQRNRNVW